MTTWCCIAKISPPLRPPSSYASLSKTFFPDNAQFVDFVAAYLLFARDAHWDFSDSTAQAASAAFELFSVCYRQESRFRIFQGVEAN